jgi:hypothetical protein
MNTTQFKDRRVKSCKLKRKKLNYSKAIELEELKRL